MKKIALLFIMVFACLSVFSQNKWAFTVSGGVGASINSSNYSDHWGNEYDFYDDDDIYRNSQLSYEANVGVKFYPLKWLYVKTGLGYTRFENKYEPYYWSGDILNNNSDEKLTLDGFNIPFIAGFTFPSKSRLYPFAEVGFLTFFTFNDDFADKKFYLGTTGKIGGGFKITDQFAIEVAISSTQLYNFKRHRNDYWRNDNGYRHNRYDDDYSSHVTFNVGASVGCSISF